MSLSTRAPEMPSDDGAVSQAAFPAGSAQQRFSPQDRRAWRRRRRIREVRKDLLRME